jgi:hypothetical protein
VISLVIPCWKDRAAALLLAQKWASHPLIHEVIIAGVQTSNDLSHPKIKQCATARPGRGLQMNVAAEVATGEVLLFHHVDSVLTEAHLQSLAHAMSEPARIGGAFYRKFDERHPGLRWLESFERWHSRAFGTIYGDQSIFVRREHFQRIGRFAPIPLMEDVDFSRRFRCSGKITLLDPPMQSSAAKQIENGSWKVTLRNLFFLILFRIGVSPDRLHRWYYRSAVDRRRMLGSISQPDLASGLNITKRAPELRK